MELLVQDNDLDVDEFLENQEPFDLNDLKAYQSKVFDIKSDPKQQLVQAQSKAKDLGAAALQAEEFKAAEKKE